MLYRHAKHGSWLRCKHLGFQKQNQTLQVNQAKVTKYERSYELNLCSGTNYIKKRACASSQKDKQFKCKETTCSVKHEYNIVRFKVLTHSPRMQCKESPKPAKSIYNTPTAQRNVIHQHVIAGPSKTSHQKTNKYYTSVTNNMLYIKPTINFNKIR